MPYNNILVKFATFTLMMSSCGQIPLRNTSKMSTKLWKLSVLLNYMSMKRKRIYFAMKLNFLGHKVSQNGIEANGSKVDKILEWPVPKSTNDVWAFLGLVHYLNVFLSRLATQSQILSSLTTKECDKKFPIWTEQFNDAFLKIKNKRHCCLLRMPNSDLPPSTSLVPTSQNLPCHTHILYPKSLNTISWFIRLLNTHHLQLLPP